MGGSAAAASASTGGRERAIEALIDREPNGDFYRAARVVVRLLLFVDVVVFECDDKDSST